VHSWVAPPTRGGPVTAGLGYGVYLGAASGQPLTALVFLLLGAVVLVSALGR
jgi:hypothetical protein